MSRWSETKLKSGTNQAIRDAMFRRSWSEEDGLATPSQSADRPLFRLRSTASLYTELKGGALSSPVEARV